MEFATEASDNKIPYHLRQLESVSMETKALLIYKLPCHQVFVVTVENILGYNLECGVAVFRYIFWGMSLIHIHLFWTCSCKVLMQLFHIFLHFIISLYYFLLRL